MKIEIDFIPNHAQRYDTLGDWWFTKEQDLQIRVSNNTGLGQDEQFLVALHELVEVWLCRRRGISQERVDNFDLNYKGPGEPGDANTAPYRREHRFAMLIEHLMAHELGLGSDYGHVA